MSDPPKTLEECLKILNLGLLSEHDRTVQVLRPVRYSKEQAAEASANRARLPEMIEWLWAQRKET